MSLRKFQNIKQFRAEVEPDGLNKNFNNLKTALASVPPDNILNYDETNLSYGPGRKKCVFRRGVKYPEGVFNFSKRYISVMLSGRAASPLRNTQGRASLAFKVWAWAARLTIRKEPKWTVLTF